MPSKCDEPWSHKVEHSGTSLIGFPQAKLAHVLQSFNGEHHEPRIR